jgi:hypothetical protein
MVLVARARVRMARAKFMIGCFVVVDVVAVRAETRVGGAVCVIMSYFYEIMRRSGSKFWMVVTIFAANKKSHRSKSFKQISSRRRSWTARTKNLSD